MMESFRRTVFRGDFLANFSRLFCHGGYPSGGFPSGFSHRSSPTNGFHQCSSRLFSHRRSSRLFSHDVLPPTFAHRRSPTDDFPATISHRRFPPTFFPTVLSPTFSHDVLPPTFSHRFRSLPPILVPSHQTFARSHRRIPTAFLHQPSSSLLSHKLFFTKYPLLPAILPQKQSTMGGMWTYLLAVLLNCGNLFLQVFFAVMYTDLESDYINPIELCQKLNQYIPIEAALQAFVSFLFLISGEWLSLLFNLPLIAFNGRAFYYGTYKLDATEIFRTVNRHKRESFIRIGVYLIFFFYYLYSMIVAIVGEDE